MNQLESTSPGTRRSSSSATSTAPPRCSPRKTTWSSSGANAAASRRRAVSARSAVRRRRSRGAARRAAGRGRRASDDRGAFERGHARRDLRGRQPMIGRSKRREDPARGSARPALPAHAPDGRDLAFPRGRAIARPADRIGGGDPRPLGDGDGLPGVPPRMADFVLKMPRGASSSTPRTSGRSWWARTCSRARASSRPARVRDRSPSPCAGPPAPRAGWCPMTSDPTSRPARLATSSPSSGRCPTGSSCAKVTSARSRAAARSSTGRSSTCPNHGTPSSHWPTCSRRRDPLRVPADDEPGAAARALVGAQRVRASGDVRGAPPLVARDGPKRSAGSADGRAHGLHHVGSASELRLRSSVLSTEDRMHRPEDLLRLIGRR